MALEPGPKFLYEIVNQAEFESDLAFELWPELRVTYRPVRTWLKRNANPIRRWNGILAGLNTMACFQVLGMAAETEGTWDFWMILGTAMALHGAATVMAYLVNMNHGLAEKLDSK